VLKSFKQIEHIVTYLRAGTLLSMQAATNTLHYTSCLISAFQTET